MPEIEWHPTESRLGTLLAEGLCEIPLGSPELFRESKDRWRFPPNFLQSELDNRPLGAEFRFEQYSYLPLCLRSRACFLVEILVALLLPLLSFLELV